MEEKKLNKLQGQLNYGRVKLSRALSLPQNAPYKTALTKFKSAADAITVLQNREGTHKLSFRIIRSKNNHPKECRKWHTQYTLSGITLHSAINEHLFHQLERRVAKMMAKRKICILQFEDINLTSHLRRQVRDKNIYHYTVVFTVQGVKTHYKQPISYIFCSSSTPVLDLSTQIKRIISKLQAIGLTVIATVCKSSNLNVCTINWLIRDTKKQYLRQEKLLTNKIFEVNGQKIIPLYNPRHLIRVLRNNLIDYNLKYQLDGVTKVAKWEHVVALYDAEVDKELKLLPLLTEEHVKPNRISRSSVESAMDIVNCNVGAVMTWLLNYKLSMECEDTALLLLFFGNLCESLNGTYLDFTNRSRKPTLGLITSKSLRKEVWSESKYILETMEFCSNGKSRVLPSVSKWLDTIDSMEYLVELLFNDYKVAVERWKKFTPFVNHPKVLKKCIKVIHSHFGSECHY